MSHDTEGPGQMASDYVYWIAALAGRKPATYLEDGPQAGYYRQRRKNGSDMPVAIWRDNGEMVSSIGDLDLDTAKTNDIWTTVCDSPVSHADYQHRISEGRWPNENVALLNSRNKPDENSIEALRITYDDLIAEAKRMLDGGPAKTQEQADQASDIANRFAEIATRAVALHKIEKQPHLDAGRDVDKKWFTLRDRAADVKSQLKGTVVTPFLVKLKREQDALVAKARAADIRTEELVQPIHAGSLKRTVGLKPVTVAQIDDWQKCVLHFMDNTELRELVQRLATRTVRAGSSVPGCTAVTTDQAV